MEKFRKLSGKYVPSPTPCLKIDNVMITKPEEVAEKFGKHFSEISSSKNYSAHFNDIRNSTIALDFKSENNENYNAKFSLRELREVLSSSETTSPGGDNITYGMLKHLPDDARCYLLKILNKIWETGIIPSSWKIAIVGPIAKPLKNPQLPTSYRSRSFTSCVWKLFEKMVNSRLMWCFEKKGLLSNIQFAFRKNRPSLDQLVRLSSLIQN